MFVDSPAHMRKTFPRVSHLALTKIGIFPKGQSRDASPEMLAFAAIPTKRLNPSIVILCDATGWHSSRRGLRADVKKDASPDGSDQAWDGLTIVWS